MNHYGSNTPEYRQLKRLYKLLFKKYDELDFKTYKKRINFKYSHLTDNEVVERLITLSPSLRDDYEFYQDVTHIVTKTSNSNELDKVLNSKKKDVQYLNLPDQMKKL